MIKKILQTTILILAVPISVQAGELAISFSDKTAQLAFSQQVADYDTGRAVFGVRGLYNDRKDSELLSFSYDVLAPLVGSGLEIGAGVRAYYVNAGPNSDEVGAGGIGALIRFVPAALPQASFSSSFYYCPEVFNFLDGEGLWDAEVTASFSIVPRATVFVSYTEIEADIENRGERTLDETFRIGLVLGF